MKIPGVIRKSRLSSIEPDPNVRRRLLRDGAMRSAGQWYVTPEAPDDLVALLEMDMRPTCLDAAALHGLWVPVGHGVHAFCPRVTSAPSPPPMLMQIRRRIDPRTGRLAPPPQPGPGEPRRPLEPLILHRPSLRTWPDDDPVPDITLTLEHAARCLTTLDIAILIESALNKDVLSRRQLDDLLAGLPRRKRTSLGRVRSDAQSGTETAVRWWLEQRRVPVRTQVRVLPGIRVDILIGTNWVIECDSRRFHDDPEQSREDRRRDLALAALGYKVTRLTWEQVFLTWDRTSAVLMTLLQRRLHRRALPV
ncbi:endonuclease domain-containing protein [Brachybacterium kimchii]|uniref:Endonuclease domain-containing protein n=1 Tax=Brachybacterium kimchii TaxID=2942909 RepID=A0ABY4N3V4_9MICO|nr:endonuclease domain-containing protein [Brachybacterium kimchii]UQN28447.1 endonuclease domain-containing protein [Brachybacterium kimchii]